MVFSNELNGLDLGDSRLNKRCMDILDMISKNPALSFPSMANTWGSLKAIYRFFCNPKVSRQKILDPHLVQTVTRCQQRKVLLAVQDTTTLSFSTHSGKKGLGHVGTTKESGLGMLVHNVIAVDGETREPLGVLSQEVIVRKNHHPSNETYRDRLKRPRESDKWLQGVREVKDLLPTADKILHVADREADIYFLMKEILQKEQGFVIRCARNRLTQEGNYLKDCIKQAAPKGEMIINVQRNGKRPHRKASVMLRSCTVSILPPKVVGRKGVALSANVVVIEELEASPKETALFWVLLTSESVDSFEQCKNVMQYYQTRWLIEEFHKGLKSGCKIENRQLADRERLENALAVFSIMAIQLLYVRHCAHTNDFQKPYEGISESQRTILKHEFPKEDTDFDPQKTLILIARLGGFIGRKSDGMPGWITLMRGMQKLLLIEYGYTLAQLMGKG